MMYDLHSATQAMMYLNDLRRMETTSEDWKIKAADLINLIMEDMQSYLENPVKYLARFSNPSATAREIADRVNNVSATPAVKEISSVGNVIESAFQKPTVAVTEVEREWTAGDPCPMCAKFGWANWKKEAATFHSGKWGLVCDGKNPTKQDDQGRSMFANHKASKVA